ncbi:MAG: DNRLRE domain-containing protein [Lachnospiraceae bacterium]|jgi:RHS repeat-associated protein|nr:DNRLRE domain-containing protein [Lachnospiraceae bacterium]
MTRLKREVKRIIAIIIVVTVFATSISLEGLAKNNSSNLEQTREKVSSSGQIIETTEELEPIESKKTEESTTFDLGDNKRMLVYHGEEVRFEDEKGNLKDYDSSLVEVKGEKTDNGLDLDGYVYENKEGDKKQYIPEQLSEETPIIMENDKYSFSMTPLDKSCTNEKVKVEKEEVVTPYEETKEMPIKATYGSGQDKILYEYISLNKGIKENIILKEKPKSNIFEFKISLKELVPEITEVGTILLKDKTNSKVIAVIDKPFMNDASKDAYSEDINTEITPTEKVGDYKIKLTLSKKYLNSKERKYPVVVDPSNTWQGSSEVADAYVISGYPSSNFFSSGVKKIVAGKGSQGTNRTYIRYEYLGTKIKGKYVESAQMTLYEGSGSTNRGSIGIYNVNTSWAASTLTWNNKPAPQGGSLATVKTNGNTNHALNFNLTNHVRKYANGTLGNHGMLIRDTAEGSNSYTEFYGSRTTTATYRPKLVVVYYDGPTKATSVKVNNTYVKGGAYAKVSWSGISSRNLASVQYRIAKQNDAGTITNETHVPYTNLSSTYTKGTANDVSIPGTNTLAEGRYRIYVRGRDAGGINGAGVGVNIIVDKTNPIFDSANGFKVSPITTESNTTKDKQPTLSWKVTDKYFSKVVLYIDNKEYKTLTVATGSQKVDVGKLTKSGNYQFKISAFDKAGNVVSKTINYHVDVDGPVIKDFKIEPITNNNVFSNNKAPKITWNITDNDFDKNEIYLDDELVTTLDDITVKEYIFSDLSKSEKYEIKLKSFDTKGNVNEVIVEYYLDIDLPEFSEVEISPSSSSNSPAKSFSPEISWKCKETSLKEILYSFDGEIFEHLSTEKDGSISLSSEKFPEGGEYNISLKAVDKAGNTSEVKEVTYFLANNINEADFENIELSVNENYGKRFLITKFDARDDGKYNYTIYRGNTANFQINEGINLGVLKRDLFIDKEILDKGNYFYKIVGKRKTNNAIFYSNEVRHVETKGLDEFNNRLGNKNYLSYQSFDNPIGSGSVEKSSGNFNYHQNDFELTNGQVSLGLVRTYNSGITRNSMIGMGWSDSYHKEIYIHGNDRYFIESDGSVFKFTKVGNSYVCNETKNYNLKESNNKYEIETKDNLVLKFNTYGQLDSIVDSNFNSIRNKYDGLGRLVFVKSNENTSSEKHIRIKYNEPQNATDTNGERENSDNDNQFELGELYKVSKIILPDGSKLSYTFDNNQLKNVIRSLGEDSISYKYTYKDTLINKIFDGEENVYEIGFNNNKCNNLKYPSGEYLDIIYTSGKTEVKKYVEENKQVSTESTEFSTENGKVLKETDGKGRVITFEYLDNKSFLLSKTRSKKGYETLNNNTVVFNEIENVVESEITYDENENITTEELSDGTSTNYEYDEDGDLISKTSLNGDEILEDLHFTYDDNHNLKSENDKVNKSLQENTYDNNGNTILEVTKDKNNAAAPVIEEVNTKFDEKNNPIKQVVESESSGIKDIVECTYDSMGRVLTETNGKTKTTYDYDFLGRVIKKSVEEKDAAPLETNTKYNKNGTIIEEVDERGAKTKYSFDSMNRLVKTEKSGKDIASTTTKTVYSFEENLSVSDGISNRTESFVYKETSKNENDTISEIKYTDILGNIVKEVEGNLTHDYKYDLSGHKVVSVSMSSNGSNKSINLSLFDQLGNEFTTIINPIISNNSYVIGDTSLVTKSDRDSKGNVIKETDEKGNITKLTYNDKSNITSVDVGDDGADLNLSYQYNEDGSRTSIRVDGNGKKTIEEFNAAGLTKSITDENASGNERIVTNYTYDKSSNKTKEEYGDGSYIKFNYNDRNLLTSKEKYNSEDEKESEDIYEYNIYGNIKKCTVKNGSNETTAITKYTYDAFGRESKVTSSYGSDNEKEISYTYDDLGNVKKVTYPNGTGNIEYVEYVYDSLGKITAIKVNGKDKRSYTYDNQERVSKVKDYSKPDSSTYIEKIYEYDFLDRVTSITNLESGNEESIKEKVSYSYDKTSNIISKTRLSNLGTTPINETINYTYDNHGRLTGSSKVKNKSIAGESDNNSAEENADSGNVVETNVYTYDDAGNRITKVKNGVATAYSYNGLNQLISEDSPSSEINYSYDLRGNQIQVENVTAEYTDNFKYSVGNEMTIYERKNASDDIIASQSNEYNSDGIRISKTEGNNKKLYYYDRGNVLFTEKNGNTDTVNIIDPENQVISSLRNDNKYYNFNVDIQGSTLSIIDESNNVKAIYNYSDFGETSVTGDNSFENEIAYTGAIKDEVNNLYYMNARYYNSEIGRFISQDTYRGEDENFNQWNLYTYCYNNPSKYTDPSGHKASSNKGKKKVKSPKPSIRLSVSKYGRILDVAIAMVVSFVVLKVVYASMNKLIQRLGGAKIRSYILKHGVRKIKNCLIAWGMSRVTKYVSSFFGGVFFAFATPGTALLSYLDKRDKWGENGYVEI